MTKNARLLTKEEVIAAEDALMDFQFAVIDALNAKGISHSQFAELLGVSRARVSQMLSSDANPTIKLVGRALAVLGLETKYVDSSAPSSNAAEWFPLAGKAVEAADIKPCSWRASQRMKPRKDSWHGKMRVANGNGVSTLAAA